MPSALYASWPLALDARSPCSSAYGRGIPSGRLHQIASDNMGEAPFFVQASNSYGKYVNMRMALINSAAIAHYLNHMHAYPHPPVSPMQSPPLHPAIIAHGQARHQRTCEFKRVIHVVRVFCVLRRVGRCVVSLSIPSRV